MTIYEIPLPENTPNFEITTVIADENLRIKIRSLNNKTYMDLTVNNNVITIQALAVTISFIIF